jgi:excisionase family DNA binding protein
MGWITTNEAAQIIGVSPMRVRQYLKERRLKFRKFGPTWMVDEESARAFKPKAAGRPPKKG